jgi:hypothetical protein
MVIRSKRNMSNIQAHTSELLSYACGILFSLGLGIILLGQIRHGGLELSSYLVLMGMMAGCLALGWVAVTGLREALIQQRGNGR